MLNLYVIKRVADADYEENDGHLVAAENVRQARELAAAAVATESADEWLTPSRSTVKQVGVATTRQKAGILLTSNKGM